MSQNISQSVASDIHSHHKALLRPLRQALYHYDPESVKTALTGVFADDVLVQLSFPFETLADADELYELAYKPLQQAIPDIEGRDTIVIGGCTDKGDHWVGCCGHFTGTFQNAWLDIPPTGHQVAFRYHEFYRFVDDKVVEVQAIWDIPELMVQANAWPMAPGLGRQWRALSPATQDGIVTTPYDEAQSQASCQHIIDMLAAMIRHPKQGGPEVMELEKFWHPKMSWYGPATMGTFRGIEGFRHWHQIPFLNAMPDRGQHDDEVSFHFFGDANYAAVTGWPNMKQTLSQGGWLGLPPSDKTITLRSLDFWRIENGLIRENWVLVDLLSVYDQLGVDVFARLREFNKARNMGVITPLQANALE